MSPTRRQQNQEYVRKPAVRWYIDLKVRVEKGKQQRAKLGLKFEQRIQRKTKNTVNRDRGILGYGKFPGNSSGLRDHGS